MRVRHTHVRSVAVAGCICRSIPPSASFFAYVCTQAGVHPCTFFCVAARSTDHRPENNSNSPQSVLTSSFLQHHNPAAQQQHWAHLARIDDLSAHIAGCDPTLPLLWTSCAQHSAPTAAAAGRVLCACGRSALYAQYYCSVRCCCQRHWLMHAHLPQYVTDTFYSVQIIPDMFVDSSTIKANCSYKHRVHTYSSVRTKHTDSS